MRLREAYLSGIEDAETYATTKLSIEQEITAAKQQLANIPQPLSPDDENEQIRSIIADAVSVISDPAYSTAQKNTAAEKIIEKIIYDSRANTLQLYYRLFWN